MHRMPESGYMFRPSPGLFNTSSALMMIQKRNMSFTSSSDGESNYESENEMEWSPNTQGESHENRENFQMEIFIE